MCEICGQDPCHPRCPNAPEPKEVHICSECLEGIYPGDRFYESCGSYVCEECLKGIGSISAGGYTAFSGAIPIVCEITNNGNSWTYSHLRVYNGIIVGYWN